VSLKTIGAFHFVLTFLHSARGFSSKTIRAASVMAAHQCYTIHCLARWLQHVSWVCVAAGALFSQLSNLIASCTDSSLIISSQSSLCRREWEEENPKCDAGHRARHTSSRVRAKRALHENQIKPSAPTSHRKPNKCTWGLQTARILSLKTWMLLLSRKVNKYTQSRSTRRWFGHEALKDIPRLNMKARALDAESSARGY